MTDVAATSLSGLTRDQEIELYEMSQKFSHELLFRLNVQTMSIQFLGGYIENFDIDYYIENLQGHMQSHAVVSEEDTEAFAAMLVNMRAGVEQTARFRLLAKDGRKDWYQVQYALQYDESGTPTYALGTLKNVQNTEDLQSRASHDLLTGCYNKGAFEKKARFAFDEAVTAQEYVLFIIDVDNFKAINDHLGHFMGDIALKEVADKLKKMFRECDCVARVGGDEFAVLMQGALAPDVLAARAQAVVDALDITYEGAGHRYRISGSVGIARFAQDGTTYEELYKNADAALYHSKHKGKNGYTIYDDTIACGTMANTTPFDMANRALSHHFDKDVAVDSFNMLFANQDTRASVDMVLRHLGERFGVDRCYVFARIDTALTGQFESIYQNTHEWCKAGVEPQIDFLQEIPFALFNELFVRANEDGVYYTNDLDSIPNEEARKVLKEQNIRSLLHAYIKQDELVEYCIGFDDCTNNRVWKPNEISTLMYASKIIAQALAHQCLLQKVYHDSQEKLAVLDSLNLFAYIVDVKTHQLQYYNTLTKQRVPEIEVGSLCYEVVRGKTAPCADCPLKLMKGKNAKKVRSLIYNDYLDAEILVTASRLVSYDGKESAFISSTEITDIVRYIPPDKRDPDGYVVYSDL